MAIEDLVEALTPENFHTARPTIEVSVPTIPAWIKWLGAIGLLGLVILIRRAFIKDEKEKKNLAEVNRLKWLNQELEVAKTDKGRGVLQKIFAQEASSRQYKAVRRLFT